MAFNDDGEIVGFKDHFTANVGAISAAPGWGMAFLTGAGVPDRLQDPQHRRGRDDRDDEQGALERDARVRQGGDQPGDGARGGPRGPELGMDVAEVRRRNLIRKDEFPYRTNPASTSTPATTTRCSKRRWSRWTTTTSAASRRGSANRGATSDSGSAFELTPEAADIPGTLVGGYDTSTVKMDPSGKVTVLTGVTTPGSGNDTGIAQIVADELGVNIDDVTLVQGDTGVCPYGFGNYSGRSMVVGGNSSLLAARDIREKLAIVAGTMLEADPETLELRQRNDLVRRDGAYRWQSVSYTIYTLAFATAHNVEPPLESTRTYKPDNITHFPDEKGRIQPYPTYSNAVHAAVVEVDVETGKVDLDRFGVLARLRRDDQPDVHRGPDARSDGDGRRRRADRGAGLRRGRASAVQPIQDLPDAASERCAAHRDGASGDAEPVHAARGQGRG